MYRRKCNLRFVEHECELITLTFLSTEWGSTKTGEQEQLILTALNCVLRVPRYIPQEKRFDVRVLVRQSQTKQDDTT